MRPVFWASDVIQYAGFKLAAFRVPFESGRKAAAFEVPRILEM